MPAARDTGPWGGAFGSDLSGDAGFVEVLRAEEQRVAFGLGDGPVAVVGGGAGAGEGCEFLVVEALEGCEQGLDLGGAASGGGFGEQGDGEAWEEEGVVVAVEEGVEVGAPGGGEAAEGADGGVAGEGFAGAAVDADEEAEQAGEGAEGVEGLGAGAVGAVEVVGGEGVGLGGVAEAEIAVAIAGTEERVEEVEGAGDVESRAAFADQAGFEQAGVEVRGAGGHRDPVRLADDGAQFGVAFAAAGVAVLGEASAEVFGLADVDQLSGLVEHLVDAGSGGDVGEAPGTEESVEGAAAGWSPGRRRLGGRRRVGRGVRAGHRGIL